MFLPHFDIVCDLLLLNRRTATWNLFVNYIITKQTTTHTAFFISKYFQHNAKATFCPLRRTRKEPFDKIYYVYKMKQSHWLLSVAKNRYRKITPLSNLTRALLLAEWNLTAKAELNLEISDLEEIAGKVKSLFVITAALWAEKLGRCLESYRRRKKYPRKTCGWGQPRGALQAEPFVTVHILCTMWWKIK